MTEAKLNNHQKTCPSCGAPVVSEICITFYCYWEFRFLCSV